MRENNKIPKISQNLLFLSGLFSSGEGLRIVQKYIIVIYLQYRSTASRCSLFLCFRENNKSSLFVVRNAVSLTQFPKLYRCLDASKHKWQRRSIDVSFSKFPKSSRNRFSNKLSKFQVRLFEFQERNFKCGFFVRKQLFFDNKNQWAHLHHNWI